MKKLKPWLTALVAAMAMIVCLTACGSKAGTYQFSSMKQTANGVTMELSVGQSYMGMVTLDESFMTVTLHEDGTASIASMGQTVTGSWKENADDSSKIDLTMEGETETVSCNGSVIVIETDGASITLKK